MWRPGLGAGRRRERQAGPRSLGASAVGEGPSSARPFTCLPDPPVAGVLVRGCAGLSPRWETGFRGPHPLEAAHTDPSTPSPPIVAAVAALPQATSSRLLHRGPRGRVRGGAGEPDTAAATRLCSSPV